MFFGPTDMNAHCAASCSVLLLSEDIDILLVKRTVATRNEDGNIRLWSVKRKRDVFTIAPA
jgi:hypothetical protein